MNLLLKKLLQLQTLEFGNGKARESAEKTAALRAQIPPSLLQSYDRMRARGRKAVAPLRNQVCTGCHMQVPRGVFINILTNDAVRACDHCGRFLYVTDADETLDLTNPPRRKSRRTDEMAQSA